MANVKNRASEILADNDSIQNELDCIRETIRTIAYNGEDGIDAGAMLYAIERLTNYQDILELIQSRKNND